MLLGSLRGELTLDLILGGELTLDVIVFQGAPHGGLGAPGSNAAGPKPQLLAGCSEVSHSFLTAKSWGFPAARPGGRTQDCEGGLLPARFRFLDRLSDLYGYMVVLALPRVQGIHRPRPDPNRSCLQIVQRFLTAFSQPSLGDFQPPLRTFRPRRLIRPKPSDFAIRTPVRGMFHLVCNSDDGCDSRRCWCATPPAIGVSGRTCEDRDVRFFSDLRPTPRLRSHDKGCRAIDGCSASVERWRSKGLCFQPQKPEQLTTGFIFRTLVFMLFR